jgi:hypothetical protein
VRLHRDYFAENAKDARVQANRLGDGLQSDFYHVVIVVDLHKVNGQEIEPLADQIAVLALSQPRSFDTCLTPASITNLLSPGCEAKAKAVTAVDLAYLRGLYDVDTGTNFVQQRGQIADLMSRAWRELGLQQRRRMLGGPVGSLLNRHGPASGQSMS